MPMTSAQLAALVERARLKAPPVVAPPSETPAPRRKLSDYPPEVPKPVAAATAQNVAAAIEQPPTPPEPATAPPDDFPFGWELRKESWHFHRRFFTIFKRPMHRGEYSHLLWQIRRRTAEHLWEDCWRVTLPGGKTLAVRGSVWKLITILPKNWQPPTPTA